MANNIKVHPYIKYPWGKQLLFCAHLRVQQSRNLLNSRNWSLVNQLKLKVKRNYFNTHNLIEMLNLNKTSLL